MPRGGCTEIVTTPRDFEVSEHKTEDRADIQGEKSSRRRGAGSPRRHTPSKSAAGRRPVLKEAVFGPEPVTEGDALAFTRADLPRPPLLGTVGACVPAGRELQELGQRQDLPWRMTRPTQGDGQRAPWPGVRGGLARTCPV